MAVARPAAPSAPRSTASRAATKVTGRGPLRRTSTPSTGVAYALRRAVAGRPRPDPRDRRRPRRSRSPGVLAVLTHENAPRAAATADDAELARAPVRPRSPTAARSSPLVVADSLEAAREGARLVARRLRRRAARRRAAPTTTRASTRPTRSTPASRPTPSRATSTAALAAAAVPSTRRTRTPGVPQQPDGAARHASRAGTDGDLTLHDSTQGASPARAHARRGCSGSSPSAVRVVAEHVGGGFGSKGTPRPHAVLAALAATAVGRPVKLGAHPPADVRARRLPHADDPAGPARRRRATGG